MACVIDHTIGFSRVNGYGRWLGRPVWISAVQEGRRVVWIPLLNMDAQKSDPAPYTKAPWTIEDEGDEYDIRLELKGDGGSKPIAHLYEAFHSPLHHEEMSEAEVEADHAEYAANLRLIVAAPRLLEQCREISRLCEAEIDQLQDDDGQLGGSNHAVDKLLHRLIGQRVNHWQTVKQRVDQVIRAAEFGDE